MSTHDNQYHLCIKAIGKAAGRSAVAAAAYRSGTVLTDEQTGEVHDYRRKGGVFLSEIVTREDADWCRDRQTLWSRLSSATRRNGRTCTEVEAALPASLTDAQRVALVRGFAAALTAEGIAVDFSIHAPHPRRRGAEDLPGDDPKNWHVHILCSHLPVTPDGPGKPVSRLFDGPERITAIRAQWAAAVNRAYELAGSDLRQDHRSHRDRQIDQEPTRHIGPAAIAMERRGIRTERGATHRARAERRRAGTALNAFAAEQARRQPAQPAGIRPVERAPLTEEQRQRRAAGYKARLLAGRYGPLDEFPRIAGEVRRLDLDAEGGPRILFRDGCAVDDHGDRITVVGAWQGRGRGRGDPSATAIGSMIALARAKGWEAINLTGPDDFKQRAACAAVAAGLEVANPELRHIVEQERRRLSSERAAATDSQVKEPSADTAGEYARAAAAAHSKGDLRTVRAVFATCPPALRQRVGDLLDQRAATLIDRATPGELDARMASSRGAALARLWADLDTPTPTPAEPARVEAQPPAALRTLAERAATSRRAALEGTADPYDAGRDDTALRYAARRASPEDREAALHALRHDPRARNTLADAIALAEVHEQGTAGLSAEERAAARRLNQSQETPQEEAPTEHRPEPPRPVPPWLDPPKKAGASTGSDTGTA